MDHRFVTSPNFNDVTKSVRKRRQQLQARDMRYLATEPGRDISFPILIRKEIETRKLERKSKQKISRLIDLLYRLNDIISP